MKKNLLIAISGILICACSSSKIGNEKMKYFDENYVEVSKSKFNRIRSTNKFLDISGDSAHHGILTSREKHGNINNRPLLEALLENSINREVDSDKPLVIIYHPGKDPCNSSGAANKDWITNWYGQLKEGLNQVAQVQPIYIYKDEEGLEKYDGIITWHKNPEGTIERLFFKYHYPCKSFVVISKKGNYLSYFGEFSKEYVWEATQIMNE